MRCNVTEEQLWSWVDRCADELEPHLAYCSHCRGLAGSLRRQIADLAATAAPPTSLPANLGAYRVRRRLGAGAQGVVYEVEQPSTGRLVALKLLRCYEGGEADARWFEREMTSLARLRHPGIAAIIDAGSTPDGQRFLVLELVDGAPLTTYVREMSLPRTDRIDLFLRVASAVQYAHQRGVIHRDLKPANILVDRDGHPHVLDFGVARVLDTDLTLTLQAGQAAPLVGTLPYISPEQAGGESADVDVRSDVYSLGVLLYELLTDRLPHPPRRSSPHETLRAIREDAPPRPAALDRALRGDLDTILLKALQKEPARRYPSVAALIDDLQRHLAGEPIHARPPTALYVLHRLVRRNRLTAGLAAAFLAAVLLFGAFAGWQALRIADERDAAVLAGQRERIAAAAAAQQARRAEQAVAEALRTHAFLEELFTAADPRWTRREMTVRELLDLAEQRLDAGISDPALEARLRLLLGRTFSKYGFGMRGAAQLRAALALRERISGPDHPATAEACAELAATRFAPEDRAEGVALFERALEIRRSALGSDHPDTLATIASLARLRQIMGARPAAAALLDELVASQRAAGRPGPLSDAIAARAALAAEEGAAETALTLADEALALRRAAFGELDRQTARSLYDMAEVLLAIGRTHEAQLQFEQALERFRDLPGDTANVTLVLQRLATIDRQAGDLPAARTRLEEALSVATERFPAWHYIVLSVQAQLGECLVDDGDFDAAEMLLCRSHEGYVDLLGATSARPRAIAAALVRLYEAWDRPQDAACYREPTPER